MFLLNKYNLGLAALLLGGSVFLSRLMGLVRDKVISWQYGAASEADLYFTAFVVPDFLNYLLAGGYISITLIPLLSQCFAEDEAAKKAGLGQDSSGWRLFSAIIVWLTVGIVSLTSLAFYFAPELAKLVGPGFSELEQGRLALFLRLILPAQVFFLPGAALSALLYMRKQFLVPALMPLIYNGFIILGGIVYPWFDQQAGMEGFCLGVGVGALLGALVLPWWAVRAGGLEFRIVFSHPLLKRFLYLALPLMIGQSIVVLDEQLVRIFGSLAGEGWVSLLNYARRIMLVPVGVVAQAAGLASFPFLAALAAKGDLTGFNQILNQALRGSLILALPLTLYMGATAIPILGLIFQGGQFSTGDTLAAAPLLQLMLIAMPCWVIQQVIGRAFYAQQDTMTPAILGTVITVLALPGYTLASQEWGGQGVAGMTSLAVMVYTLSLTVVYKRRQGSAALQNLSSLSLKNLLICVPGLSFCLWLVYSSPWATVPQNLLNIWFHYTLMLLSSGLVFGLSYLILAWLFLPEVWAWVVKLRNRR